MISLTSELTDRKSRHARGWLFFDAECRFCTRIAAWLAAPLMRRGLAVAPLQDPRVRGLLGLAPDQLLRAVRFVSHDGTQYAGADALLAVAHELWWGLPLVWMAKLPGTLSTMRAAYECGVQRWHCTSHRCLSDRPLQVG